MKAIKTKPISKTRNNPFRIQAQDSDGNKILVPYDESLSFEANNLIAAERFAKHLGLKGRFFGAHIKDSEMQWIMESFENEYNFEIT